MKEQKEQSMRGSNMNDLQIINFGGVDCYEKDGVAYLKLENVARGLGFTRVAESGNEVIRWERVNGYLKDLGVPTCGHEDFIPENIFYRLAMKAKNETAEKFQAKVADEIIPSIRKHGAYMTEETLEKALTSPDFLIELATKLKEEKEKNKRLEADNEQMKPKAEYFDNLVDRNLLTNFTDTAKELGIKRKDFIKWLLGKGYCYRDAKGDIKPYAQFSNTATDKQKYFELKEWQRDSTAGTQTLVTPRGREAFRLMY